MSIAFGAARGRPGCSVNADSLCYTIGNPTVANRYNNQTRSQRVTLGGTLNYQPISWFRNRATMGIDASSVVAIIDDFERSGVAERRRDPTDRRRYAIHLTRTGKALLQRAREAAQAAEEALLADLDADERRVLHVLLVKVSRTVDRTPGPDINCGPLR